MPKFHNKVVKAATSSIFVTNFIFLTVSLFLFKTFLKTSQEACF